MDDRRFDSIAKAASVGASRRTALKKLGALAAAGAALAGVRGTGAARPQCPGNQTVCNAEGVR